MQLDLPIAGRRQGDAARLVVELDEERGRPAPADGHVHAHPHQVGGEGSLRAGHLAVFEVAPEDHVRLDPGADADGERRAVPVEPSTGALEPRHRGGGGARIAAPMVGGMITSTALTLLVIRVLYYGWRKKAISPEGERPAV